MKGEGTICAASAWYGPRGGFMRVLGLFPSQDAGRQDFQNFDLSSTAGLL
jgi:hypothetical protein